LVEAHYVQAASYILKTPTSPRLKNLHYNRSLDQTSDGDSDPESHPNPIGHSFSMNNP
jgi:hypothetical protein